MKKLLGVAMMWLVGGALAYGSGIGPYGSFWNTKDAKAGWGGGLKLTGDLVEWLSLEVRGSYLGAFKPDDDKKYLEDMKLVPVEADLVFNIPLGDVLKLYAGAGGGYYILPKYTAKTGYGKELDPDLDPQDTWGFFGLGGISIKISQSLSLFGEAKYTALKIKEMKIDGEKVDLSSDNVLGLSEIDLSGVGANAGLLVTW